MGAGRDVAAHAVLTGRKTIPTTTTAALQSRNITLRFDIGFRTIASPAWECVHSGADCGPLRADPFGLATETRRTRRETIVVRRPWSVARSRGCQAAVDRLHFRSSPLKTENQELKTRGVPPRFPQTQSGRPINATDGPENHLMEESELFQVTGRNFR